MGTTASKNTAGEEEMSKQREERAAAAEVRAEKESNRGLKKSSVRVSQYVFYSDIFYYCHLVHFFIII
jgi:hypothetical protein